MCSSTGSGIGPLVKKAIDRTNAQRGSTSASGSNPLPAVGGGTTMIPKKSQKNSPGPSAVNTGIQIPRVR